jgi:hypothetical protein
MLTSWLDTTGILQHNDINPQWHPTDVGQIKLASHMLQYLKLKFGLIFGATGFALIPSRMLSTVANHITT